MSEEEKPMPQPSEKNYGIKSDDKAKDKMLSEQEHRQNGSERKATEEKNP